MERSFMFITHSISLFNFPLFPNFQRTLTEVFHIKTFLIFHSNSFRALLKKLIIACFIYRKYTITCNFKFISLNLAMSSVFR